MAECDLVTKHQDGCTPLIGGRRAWLLLFQSQRSIMRIHPESSNLSYKTEISPPPTLRHRLRTDTRDAHECIDQIAGALDLSDYRDFCVFMLGNAMAYADLLAQTCIQTDLLTHRLDLANHDLASLALKPVSIVSSSHRPVMNELGLTYVIAGSYLGAKHLNKTRLSSCDRRVLAASRSLADTALPNLWRGLVKDLSAKTSLGLEADQAVASAGKCFNIFADAFQRAKRLNKVDICIN